MANISKIKLPNSATVYDIVDKGADRVTNKVTEISSTSTNVQYPSALAVYNAIQSAIGAAIEGSY